VTPRPAPEFEAEWARAVKALTAATEICLACHIRPDADALGSMLAVAHALRDCLPRTTVIASFGDRPFEVPRILRFLPGASLPCAGLLRPPEQVPARPQVMVTFDAASPDRLGLLEANAQAAGELIVLDHHASNPGFGTVHLVDPAAAATAVLAFELTDRLGAPLSSEIAHCLYAGLVTDTGSFKYSATTPGVHEMAARLLAAGVDPEAVAHELWDRAPFGYLGMLAAALGRAVLERGEDGRDGLVWTTVTRADRAAFGLPLDAAESVIDVVRRTDEADVAAVLKESDDGQWQVSVRSKGRTDVGRVCVALGGGGHARAAGFTACGTAAETIMAVRRQLSQRQQGQRQQGQRQPRQR
jgi:bifunctional oligoribonuclease and PAP phosphatase NrnA